MYSRSPSARVTGRKLRGTAVEDTIWKERITKEQYTTYVAWPRRWGWLPEVHKKKSLESANKKSVTNISASEAHINLSDSCSINGTYSKVSEITEMGDRATVLTRENTTPTPLATRKGNSVSMSGPAKPRAIKTTSQEYGSGVLYPQVTKSLT